MWITLAQESRARLALTDRQSIWPAQDGSDAELVVTTEAGLTQEVLIATPRLVRLRYTVDQIAVSMTLGDRPPQPWPDAGAIRGKGFELMITEHGALVVPGHAPALKSRHASWLNLVAEDLRCSWSVPPDGAKVGAEWRLSPALPGGLPPNTTTADFDVTYRLRALHGGTAEVQINSSIRLVIEAQSTETGRGVGEMTVTLMQDRGLTRAVRNGQIELVRTTGRTQLLASTMELVRV
ncbi:MAG: hypothetical protein HY903_12825 [Deltaproteobacteria bacterium]|nr:hypothetical protein [Deltaproteobacteria bacterium]